MSSGTKVLRCIHCGTPLQSIDPSKEGYISAKVLGDSNRPETLYCESCYQTIIDTNKLQEDIEVNDQLLNILDDAVNSNALIVWAVDLFSFNGLLPQKIAKKLQNMRIVVVGTRKELFQPFNEKKMKAFINYSFEQYGIKPLEVLCVNTKNKKETWSIINKVEEKYKEVQSIDLYLIGEARSGKTSLVSVFLRNFKNKSDRLITQSPYKNTGLRIFQMPLSEKRTLYELPGYSDYLSMVKKFDKSLQKYLIPKSNLKMSSVILHTNDAFVAGSIFAFEIKNGLPSSYRFYTAYTVDWIKTTNNKVKKTIDSNRISKLRRPVSDRHSSTLDYDLYEFNIKNDQSQREIAIEGFGFITFKAKGQKIWVWLPKGTSINEGVARI